MFCWAGNIPARSCKRYKTIKFMKSNKVNPGAAALKKNPTKAKIALIKDQPKMAKNWRHLINSFPDFTYVCTCISGEEALREIPDVQRWPNDMSNHNSFSMPLLRMLNRFWSWGAFAVLLALALAS